MTAMVIEHFHGAVTRVPSTATAFPHREPGYNLVIPGVWPDASDDDANIAWVKDTFGALAPYTAGSVYVNYLADDDTARVRAAYGPCWDRLRQVKREYDPENVFHLNQNITGRPGGGAAKQRRRAVEGVTCDPRAVGHGV